MPPIAPALPIAPIAPTAPSVEAPAVSADNTANQFAPATEKQPRSLNKKINYYKLIVETITSLRSPGGSSSKAISKVLIDDLADEFEEEEPKAKLQALTKKVTVALKKLCKDGKVFQEKQSFRNVGEVFEDTSPKVKIDDIEIGEGEEAKDGDAVTVSYKGQLVDSKGQTFDYAKGFVFVCKCIFII